MTDDQKPKRRGDGTFQPGSTGNPSGRPKKDRRILHPETVRDVVYDVADFEMTAQIKGKQHKVTLLQANLLTLALAGASGDKASARSFLDYVREGSEQELREMARMTKTLYGVTPAYTMTDDPVRRASLKEAWEAARAESTGNRKRTTRGFPARKKNR